MDIARIAARANAESIDIDRFHANCPCHKDDRKSLYIAKGRDGRTLLRCNAGCGVDQILTALKLDWNDLFPTPPAPAYIAILRAKLAATSARRLLAKARCERATSALDSADATVRELKARCAKNPELSALLVSLCSQVREAKWAVSVLRDHA
jgi:hypothetical protein